MIGSSLGFRDPFLGETNDPKGEEGASDHVYDVTDERDEVVGALWVVLHNLCESLLIWTPFRAKTTTKNMTGQTSMHTMMINISKRMSSVRRLNTGVASRPD